MYLCADILIIPSDLYNSIIPNPPQKITIVATDINTVSYSIADGESDSLTVDASTGVVTFKVAPDFETLATYTFAATATDTVGNAVTQDVTITITDVVEAQVPKKTGQTTTYAAKDDGDYQKGVLWQGVKLYPSISLHWAWLSMWSR